MIFTVHLKMHIRTVVKGARFSHRYFQKLPETSDYQDLKESVT